MGGGAAKNELRCFLVQVRIVENHQNGKDTHLRGLKLYARDERVVGTVEKREGDGLEANNIEVEDGVRRKEGMLVEPDWMNEPELR